MDGWTARALARLTGVSAPTLSGWVKRGLITPDKHGRGRGGHTIGITGLMELLTVMRLKEAGRSVREIEAAVHHLRELTGQLHPLAKLSLVISGDDILWHNESSLSTVSLSALRHPGQTLMVFPVGEEHAVLLERLHSRDAVEATAVGAP